MHAIRLLVMTFLLASCAGVPAGIGPVTEFELNRYLGTWYEIARLDHRFERGLEQVTATYSANSDGIVRVVNRGFSTSSNAWKEATGKARFVGDESVGHLEVSFFGPFYGTYVIFELDKAHYQYAFVTGGENTLWFLARSPSVSEALKAKFLGMARDAGYDTNDLIFVDHK